MKYFICEKCGAKMMSTIAHKLQTGHKSYSLKEFGVER